eukprot:scaffold5605_cov105-Skeletonema_dohrnii-CCMP3373.AAC.10
MKSLTIVDGKVIETVELNSMHDRLSKTATTSPKSSSMSRMNSPRSQIKKAPMRRSTSSCNSPVPKPKMGHHVTAPSATTDNDEGNKKTITIPVRPADLHLPRRSPRFKIKVSTPTSSSASTQQKHNKSQLINILETLGIHHSLRIFSDTAIFSKPSAPQLPLNQHATMARTREGRLRQRSLRPAIHTRRLRAPEHGVALHN